MHVGIYLIICGLAPVNDIYHVVEPYMGAGGAGHAVEPFVDRGGFNMQFLVIFRANDIYPVVPSLKLKSERFLTRFVLYVETTSFLTRCGNDVFQRSRNIKKNKYHVIFVGMFFRLFF